jgi:hypothetical protein
VVDPLCGIRVANVIYYRIGYIKDKFEKMASSDNQHLVQQVLIDFAFDGSLTFETMSELDKLSSDEIRQIGQSLGFDANVTSIDSLVRTFRAESYESANMKLFIKFGMSSDLEKYIASLKIDPPIMRDIIESLIVTERYMWSTECFRVMARRASPVTARLAYDFYSYTDPGKRDELYRKKIGILMEYMSSSAMKYFISMVKD